MAVPARPNPLTPFVPCGVAGNRRRSHKHHWASRATKPGEFVKEFSAREVPFEVSSSTAPEDFDAKLELAPEGLRNIVGFAANAFATSASSSAHEQGNLKEGVEKRSVERTRWPRGWPLLASICERSRTPNQNASDGAARQLNEPSRRSRLQISTNVTTHAWVSHGTAGAGPQETQFGTVMSEPWSLREVADDCRSGPFTACSRRSNAQINSSCKEDIDGTESSPSSPRTPHSKAQKKAWLNRPVDAEEFVQAKAPVPLTPADILPISPRRTHRHACSSHFELFSRTNADGANSKTPDQRRAIRQRVQNLSVGVALPFRHADDEHGAGFLPILSAVT